MKKIYLLMGAALISAFSFAQVNVTLQVDITDYLGGGATLDPTGIRVAGNFATHMATLPDGTPMTDWSPTDAPSAMTDMGSNVWGITIQFPAAMEGDSVSYKFVNGNWGTNEGTDVANTIASDGCGTDDGSGNINRIVVVPSSDEGYQFCWDHCFRCDGSDPEISGIFTVHANSSNVTVYPNPATTEAVVNFTLNTPGTVSIDVYNITGQLVKSYSNMYSYSGNISYNLDLNGLDKGMYNIVVKSNESVAARTIVKN